MHVESPSGVALDWIHSFLTGRTQQIAYGGQLSTIRALLFGVPQGSVLWPRLYILYTAELEQVVAQHDMCLHQYADIVKSISASPSVTLTCHSQIYSVLATSTPGCERADYDSNQPRCKSFGWALVNY